MNSDTRGLSSYPQRKYLFRIGSANIRCMMSRGSTIVTIDFDTVSGAPVVFCRDFLRFVRLERSTFTENVTGLGSKSEKDDSLDSVRLCKSLIGLRGSYTMQSSDLLRKEKAKTFKM